VEPSTAPAPSALVLLIEDADADFEAVDRALRRTRPDLTLCRCYGGAEAKDWLTARQEDGTPALVLLDLNLPEGDGREFLAWVRAQSRFVAVPVVVLTTSTDPRDVSQCYEAGANGYLFKPVDFAQLEASVRGTVDYWVPSSAD
jgi:DNA-binding response OmpR family regulator